MSVSGREKSDAGVWHWTGKVFSADELRQWQGQRELRLSASAIVTPLALDELKTRGVRITRGESSSGERTTGNGAAHKWAYWLDAPNAIIEAALRALAKENLALQPLELEATLGPGWFRSMENVIRTRLVGGAVIFTRDAALVCLAANRLPGLRAVAVTSAADVKRVLASVGANVLAVDPMGRSYFEVRQILRTTATMKATCPADVAGLLQELEGHAHR
jgi:hypothetical protein